MADPVLPNPIVITAAGVQPQLPSVLRQRLIDFATLLSPGLTANLPGSLIADISGTDVAGVALCDQAWVDLFNSLDPRTSNPYLLNQLGQIYGPIPNQPTNTSVFVVFSGDPGFVIGTGFTVGDGTYQYIVQDGGIVASNGATAPLFAIATLPGTWAVPANTVDQLLTAVPSTVTLSVNNPSAGIRGARASASLKVPHELLDHPEVDPHPRRARLGLDVTPVFHPVGTRVRG